MKKRRSSRATKSAPKPAKAPRNPYARHPIMAKGGVHQQSNSAKRTAIRRETQKLARDWSATCQDFLFNSIRTKVFFC